MSLNANNPQLRGLDKNSPNQIKGITTKGKAQEVRTVSIIQSSNASSPVIKDVWKEPNTKCDGTGSENAGEGMLSSTSAEKEEEQERPKPKEGSIKQKRRFIGNYEIRVSGSNAKSLGSLRRKIS